MGLPNSFTIIPPPPSKRIWYLQADSIEEKVCLYIFAFVYIYN